jgi:DNA-binding SARP family transcriptional activator
VDNGLATKPVNIGRGPVVVLGSTKLEERRARGRSVPHPDTVREMPRGHRIRQETASVGLRLRLLSGFHLTYHQEPVVLPMSAQRVLAFLALSDRPMLRVYVAGTLWPDTAEEQARADLRSALWRLHRPGHHVIKGVGDHLQLHPDMAVDLHEMTDEVRRVRDDCQMEWATVDVDLTLLCGNLLPGWYDEWVVVERERLRQIRLHALEVICAQLTAAGRFGQAVEAGLAAVAGEPLRESAHYVLIKAHLAQGNRAEAIRQFRSHRDLLYAELGVTPSTGLEQLVREVGVL